MVEQVLGPVMAARVSSKFQTKFYIFYKFFEQVQGAPHLFILRGKFLLIKLLNKK